MLIMDLKGFISKMRSQVGFHHKDTRGQGSPGAHGDFVEEDEMYEDFVVLDPGIKDQVSADGLPSYTKVVMEPYQKADPSSYPTVSDSVTSSTSPGFSQTEIDVTHQPLSPIGDVPFELHPRLCGQCHIRRIFQGLDLRSQDFNSEQYSYNFTHEHQCIQDFDC